jgi:MFS family permease
MPLEAGSPPLGSIEDLGPTSQPVDVDRPTPAPLRLRPWTDRSVVGLIVLAVASGFGQFGAVAALGDVARGFGRIVHGTSIADQAGLSGTELGIGLAVIRLASLGGLPLAGMADRLGRRITLLTTCAIGLALTAASAASPGYWWFIVIFAAGRPLLSATSALTQVTAAEQTGHRDRAKAVALVTAGYAAGAGLTAVLHGLAGTSLGFRGIFALAVVPLALLPAVSRWVTEPDRFTVAARSADHPAPVLGAIAPPYRWRLFVVLALAFSISVVTGPATSFVFLYAQNVLHMSGVTTSTMVVVAGVLGACGLFAGRWLADRVGRRPTAAGAMTAMAVAGVIAYSGGRGVLLVGYIAGVVASSIFAPAAGALANELFPTSVRASVAGWNVAAGVLGAVTGLVIFGALADVGNRFGVAALVTFVPAILATALFRKLPETRGREPEELWPVVR